MRSILGVTALAAVALGAAPASAGGPPIVLGVGIATPVPQYFPPPGTIPAPIAPQPTAPGQPASVTPLPPLVLYTTPTIVVPVAPRGK